MMQITRWVPKRQVRIAVVASAIAALGATVTAQTNPELLGGADEMRGAPAVSAASHERTPEQEQQEQEAQPPVGAARSQSLLSAAEREALALVEQIIREQEGVLMGSSFDYDAAGRRDPFASLLVELGAVTGTTVRPPGLPGFLIAEVELKGIASAAGRWQAMVIAINQRAYFVEVGTQLYDGHVVDIRPGEVVFEQVVTDALGARRTREVTKRLRTTDGGGETP